MRNGHDGPGELADDLLQQLALVRVEVGLGLVQEEEAGFPDQTGGERGELALPAGECRRGQRHVVLVEAEPDQALRLAGETGATGLDPSIEGRLLAGEHAVHLREVPRDVRPRELGLDRTELVVERGDVGRPASTHASAVRSSPSGSARGS